jgi:benzoyl-CoA 2,3-dioxygenase component B
MRLRDDYIADAADGVARWNKILSGRGIPFQITLPHQAFYRQIGGFSGLLVSPTGEVLSAGAWESQKGGFLPTAEDSDYIQSLMQPVTEPGQYASWIAPPRVGIDNKGGDFEYVRIAA